MAKLHTFLDSVGCLDVVGFDCPGCNAYHQVPVKGASRSGGEDRERWNWNASVDKPTLVPSLLIRSMPRPEGGMTPTCHSFVRDGQIQFLEDCGHALAGQTVDLPEVAE